MAGKSWQIEGKYVEYCSCDQGCPCETMADPTYGSCTGLVAFKIDRGYCEDVRLDDLVVAGTFYFPRAIHHGQGQRTQRLFCEQTRGDRSDAERRYRLCH